MPASVSAVPARLVRTTATSKKKKKKNARKKMAAVQLHCDGPTSTAAEAVLGAAHYAKTSLTVVSLQGAAVGG